MLSDENVIFMDFFDVKLDGSDVIAGISLYENLFTDCRYVIASVNFNSEKVHEDDIFVRQDVLHFFSGESKDYKYLKSPKTLYALQEEFHVRVNCQATENRY